jgi:hypothetical protein
MEFPDRETIDAEFATMATDEYYLKEAEAICAEFALADWEAFQEAENEGWAAQNH